MTLPNLWDEEAVDQISVFNTAWEPLPDSPSTVTHREAVCVFDRHTQAFWVAPAPTKDKDGVVFSQLTGKDREKFTESRTREISNLINMGAMRVMSVIESKQYARDHPDYVIPSNMLDKWKLQDDGAYKAKSRTVLIGWKDPMIQ